MECVDIYSFLGIFLSASDSAEAANERTMHQMVPVVRNVQPKMRMFEGGFSGEAA
jgi:hypothetical protein